MPEFKPGTVAVATVRGVEGVRVLRTDDGSFPWRSAQRFGGARMHSDLQATNVRPLVVLDVDEIASVLDEGRGRWAYLIEALRHEANDFDRTLQGLADQIEAQTKPPRIPEPGLWGVVEAGLRGSDGQRWHYVRRADDGYWYTLRGAQRRWDELIDPTLIREGVDA